MSELSVALTQAAHREITKVAVRSMEGGEALPYDAEARAAVAAVLETLAAHCDPVPVEDGATSQALLSNTELRRLAAEIREDT